MLKRFSRKGLEFSKCNRNERKYLQMAFLGFKTSFKQIEYIYIYICIYIYIYIYIFIYMSLRIYISLMVNFLKLQQSAQLEEQYKNDGLRNN